MKRKRAYRRPTEKQHQATMTNFAIRQMMGLQFVLQNLGHYDFQQRVRELEEQFRAKTGRKEKK